MNSITPTSLLQDPELQPLWKAVRASGSELTALVKTLCEIPAPTFEEEKRAQWVASFMERVSGESAQRDHAGNVWVRVRGKLAREKAPTLLFSAHLDTVFSAGTDCRVTESEGKLFGPGISDNCAGLCVLLTGLRLLCEQGRPFAGEFIFAANTGEEGLGDLKGMKALCEQFKPELTGALALDGELGSIVGAAVGSRRYRVSVHGKGGHSWADFGEPSAVHQLARIAAPLSKIEPLQEPRSSFNIGVIQGGTSVNTIASHAELLLDLRSLEEFALERLDAQAQRAIASEPCPEGLRVEVEKIGERPVGEAGLTQVWQELVREVFQLNKKVPSVTVSSTDANVPLSMGIRASTLGVAVGGQAHTLKEWLDPARLPEGLELFLQTALLAGHRF